MAWEATRPGSQTKGWAFTMVGCANIFDVASSAPDTTTVASWNTSSAGTGLLVWRAQQDPVTVPDSRFDFGVRISCKSMGTAYLAFDYSVDSGENWTSLIASVGGTNLAATTIVRSLASNFSVRSAWFRMSQTNAHSRGRAQLWDVYVVGSYSTNFTDWNADPIGITDSAYRSMTIVRRPGG